MNGKYRQREGGNLTVHSAKSRLVQTTTTAFFLLLSLVTKIYFVLGLSSKQLCHDIIEIGNLSGSRFHAFKKVGNKPGVCTYVLRELYLGRQHWQQPVCRQGEHTCFSSTSQKKLATVQPACAPFSHLPNPSLANSTIRPLPVLVPEPGPRSTFSHFHSHQIPTPFSPPPFLSGSPSAVTKSKPTELG